MDALESKLGEILSSPEKMEQVMKIAGELLGGMGAGGSDGGAAGAPSESAPSPGGQAAESGSPSGGAPDLASALPAVMSMLGGAGAANSGAAQAASGDGSNGFGGIDPRFMSAAMQVLGALGKDDDSTRLLRALRPHLREERCERLDRAVQILRISGAIRAAIHSFSGGTGDVQQI